MSITDILSTIYSGFLLTGGLLSIFLRPMEDEQGVTEAVKKTVNIRYVRMRYISGICFILFGLAGYMEMSTAVLYTVDAFPLFVALLFTLYAEMLLAMCDAVIDHPRLIRRVCLLIPLVVLVALDLFFLDEETIAYVGWTYLILLVGIYTMRFINTYKYLNDCCCNTIELGSDYDILPDSMPWVARLYVGAVMLSAYSALSVYISAEWGIWVSIVLHILYFTRFMDHFIYTYSLYSKALAHYQTGQT